ncbi:MAG TPA: DUF3732 domain-containing protein [Abditibacteriaceae bacterium]
MQQQNEVANKDLLFHRQNEPFMSQAIKDTFPYFVGAIQEDRLAKEHQLRQAKRALKLAQQSLREAEAIQGRGISKALGLIAEARQVGLMDEGSNPDNLGSCITLLTEATNWNPDSARYYGGQRLTQLQQELRDLENHVVEKSNNIRAAKSYATEATGFTAEAQEQELRLQSIGLFNTGAQEAGTCPMCSQHMVTPVPHGDEIRRSLTQLRSNLDSTVRERPRLREYIQNLESESAELRLNIQNKTEEINAILRESDSARQLRDLNIRRGKVVGRITLWLESIDQTDDTSPLNEAMLAAQERVNVLESQLTGGVKEERLASILSRLTVQMTEWSNRLELEHSGNPVRLDLSKLTVMVDREDRSIPLNNVGSGENWVGAHLIAHLALHKHFRSNSRPVPGFLFLDQPTQVFYPPDKQELDDNLSDPLEGIEDEDREKVSLIFNLIFDVVESMSPEFQVIITDHADITADSRFQSCVVARWRGGEKLVPQDWL